MKITLLVAKFYQMEVDFFDTQYRYMIGQEYLPATNTTGELLLLSAGQRYLTVLTKNGSVTYDANAMVAGEQIEVELVPFSEVPATEPCRLTSNRLSPPKFNLRKFFRINPLTSAKALEVNGG